MTTIRVITVATQAKNPCSPKSYFEQFKAPWKRFGVEPVILGWGRPFSTCGMKIKYLEEYLQTHKDFDYMLWCDALDVMTACSTSVLLNEFLANFAAEAMVFAAERNCYPKPELAGMYPFTKLPYKYLNAGLWMGSYEAVTENLSLLDNDTKHVLNDQQTWTESYLNRLSLRCPIVLDRKCKLFQCLNAGSLDDLEFDGKIIRNKITGESPMVFHGNGSTDMTKICKWLDL